MDADELLDKIRALEELRRQVFKLILRPLEPEHRAGAQTHQPADAASSSSRRRSTAGLGLSPRHHMMAMESLGQAAHVLNLQGKVNRNAERLYGYSSDEAVGQGITELIIHPHDIPALHSIVGNIFTGKCWSGKFPVMKKSGERFFVVADATPLHDDDGRLMGLICLSEDTRTLQDLIGPAVSGYYYDPKN